jgi:hypothetical protein
MWIMTRLILIIGLLLTATLAAAAPSPREVQLQRQLGRSVRAGNLVQSLSLSRELRALNPTHPYYAYNQACLLARLLDTDAALDNLRDAVSLGYDDFRSLESDPDLAGLYDNPAFQALSTSLQDQLRARVRQASLWIIDGAWSAWLDLESPDKDTVSDRSTRFRFSDAGLQLEVSAPAADYQFNGQRGGVNLVVAVPGEDPDIDTDRAWQFRFGTRDGLPSGLLTRSPDHRVNTSVLELAPEILPPDAENRSLLRVGISWDYFAPYAPPVDTLFGLNIVIAPPADSSVLSLIPDPAIAVRRESRRRYVPVSLRFATESSHRFHGLVDNTIVGAEPLTMDLVVWSPTAGSCTIMTEILDTDGKSLVTSGSKGGAAELTPGLNVFQHQADLSALPVGPYLLSARMITADETKLGWETGLLRLDSDWRDECEKRTTTLNPLEQYTIRHRLRLIDNHLAQRRHRAPPTALTVTVSEISNMLYQAEKSGTILPAGGAMMAAFSDADPAEGLLSIHLSAGGLKAEGLAVLMLPPLGDPMSDPLPEALLKALDAGPPGLELVIAQPQLPPATQRPTTGCWPNPGSG